MTETIAGAANAAVPVARARGDRLFLAVAITCIAVVLVGFSRTYYLSSVISSELARERPLTLLTHIHGAIMTLWFALFATQAALIPAGRTDLHRRLGVLGVVLIGTIIPLGVIAALRAAARGFTPEGGPPPLVFLAIPLFDMVVFGILAGAGIANRRHPAVHKRLMALSCLAILTPAFARFPAGIDKMGPPAFLGLTDLTLLAFVWIDTIRNKRLHPAFGWGALLIVLSQPMRFAIASTPAWMAFAKWATGFVHH